MMADLKTAVNPVIPADDDLRREIELLFFAYRDFTGEADRQLGALGLGRAHHRAIYFIGRNPALTVSQLLAILKITKQSLSRVLQELIAKNYVVQHPGATDRRQRRLSLTARGQSLEQALTEGQQRRLGRAFATVGPEAASMFREVLAAIMDDSGTAQTASAEAASSPIGDAGFAMPALRITA